MLFRSKKREFSKIIITIVGAVTLIVSAFTMAVVWKTSDTAPLAYLIPSVFGLSLIHSYRAFPDTESGDDLTKKVRERSIFRTPATAAI